MKLLLITPYYPYPAEKTGGVHTINMILNNLSNYAIDIFIMVKMKIKIINSIIKSKCLL